MPATSRNTDQHGDGEAQPPYRLRPAERVPEPTEGDLAVIPGERPGTAVRVRRGDDEAGPVWLEQLAFSPALGWYRQRSFPVPREVLKEVGQAMKLADCLATDHPERPERTDAPTLRFPGPTRASG